VIRWLALVWAVWATSGMGLALASGGVARDVCVPVDGGAELTVEGLGRAVFAGLSTDRVRNEAQLTGGVCVEFSAIGGVLRSERLTVSGLGAGVTLTAADVVFELDDWTIAADLLEADVAAAVLVNVTLTSPDAVALADALHVDLTSGSITARSLRLATETLWVVAEGATLDGDLVALEGVGMTTCDCPPADASVRLEARTADLHLVEPSVTLHGAELVVGALRWALRDPWRFDAESLAVLLPPISVVEDPEGRRGTLVGVAEQAVAPGVRFAWDVGIGNDDRPPDLSLRVAARDGDASVDVTGASDRLRVAWRVARPLANGWTVAYAQRLEGGAWDGPARDQSVTAGWSRGWPTPSAAVAQVEAEASTFVALTAQSLAGGEIVGTRWGGSLRVHVAGEARAGWRPALEVAAGTTAYPAEGALQTWVSAAPRATLTLAGLRLDVEHLSRWVWGASPFGATVDRLGPLHRSDVRASLTFGADGGGPGRLAAVVRWNWRADPVRPGQAIGLERLELSGSTSGSAWGGRLSVRANASLAGVVDPRPGRTSSLGAAAAWSRDDWELGARVRLDPTAPGWPWREATVSVALPIPAGDWWWRPYVAVDLASFSREDARWWVGHGLDLAWTSDFGVLDVGYRYDDGIGLQVNLGVRFESRPLELDRLNPGGEEGP
jgi:hypothetical protein